MKLLPRFLALVSALVLPLALVSVWADQFATDTSGYVDRIGPLADDPDVREAAAARLAAATNGVVRDQAGPRAAQRAAGLTEDLSITVVGGDDFSRVWRNANGVAHERFEEALEDDRDIPVILDLSRLVDRVVDDLRAEGVALPDLDTTNSLRVRVASSSRIGVVRAAYSTVETYGLAIAGLYLLLLLLALGLARDRRSVLSYAAIAAALTSALLYLGLWFGDELTVSSVSATDRPLVRTVYDVLTQDLASWALIAVAVAVGVAVLNAALPRAQRAPVVESV